MTACDIAGYRALIAYGREHGFDTERLESTLKDEQRMLKGLERDLPRLAGRRP